MNFFFFSASRFDTALYGSNELLDFMQVVLSGEAQCYRQIVTVSNSEGRVICDKPRLPMVLSESFMYRETCTLCKLF